MDTTVFLYSQNLEERLQNFYALGVNDRRLGNQRLAISIYLSRLLEIHTTPYKLYVCGFRTISRISVYPEH